MASSKMPDVSAPDRERASNAAPPPVLASPVPIQARLHTEDARLNPGRHPNIDRLLGLGERGETLRVKQVFAL